MSARATRTLVRAELPPEVPDSAIDLLAECSEAVLRPPEAQTDPSSIGMIVAMPRGMAAVSISPRNYVGLNPFNPRTIREAALASGAAHMLTLLGMSQFLGFLLAFTVLMTRPVAREEALVLHKAWQIAKFDGTFTLSDILAVADDLRHDYFLEKVSEVDIRTYLNNLELSGALSPTSTGYRLAEEIHFPFGRG